MGCSYGKVISLLIPSICILGITKQLNDLFDIYFEYPILTNIEVETINPQLPAISVCPSTLYSKLAPKLVNLTLEKRVNVIPAYSDYIKFCQVNLPSGERVDCESVTQIGIYTGPMGKCFSYFESRYLKVEASQLIYKDNLFINFVVNISSPYKGNYRWKFRIYHTDKPFLFRRAQTSKLMFEPELDVEITVGMRATLKNRLPPPYHDGCADYSKMANKTKGRAIMDCIIRNYKNNSEQKGYWDLYAYIEVNKEYINETKYYMDEDAKVKKTIFPKVNRRCNKKFARNDCTKHDFRVSILRSRKAFQNNSQTTIIIPRIPKTVTMTTYTPWWTLLDLINSAGGTFSLWINFALFPSITLYLMNLINLSLKLVKQSTRKVYQVAPAQVSKSTVKMIEVLIKFICLVGCGLQCIDIGMIYLGNNTYFWVSSVQPDSMILPRLTICVDRTIDQKKFEKVQGNRSIEEYDVMNDDFTIDELFNYTINVEDLIDIKKSTVLSPFTMSLNQLSKLYQFEKQLTGKYVCFASLSPENYIGNETLIPYATSEMSRFYFYKMFLRKIDDTSQIKIFVHPYKTFSMSPATPNHLTMVIDDSRTTPTLIYFFIRQLKVLLLPQAHRSPCINYRTIGFASHQDAIDHCTTNRLKAKLNLWPDIIPVNSSEGHKVKFGTSKSYEKIMDSCIKRFPLPSCQYDYLTVQVMDEGFNRNSIMLVLYPSSDEYTEVIQALRYTLVELIVFIGGNINTWIGVAMIDLLHVFRRSRKTS